MRSGLGAICFALLLSWLDGVGAMTDQRKLELREETRSLFQHGYDGYMEHAYPADELRPLTCTPLHRDPNPGNFGVNDIHANVSMTLLDTLSSLPTVYPSAFPAALRTVTTELSFDQDVKVQVFEMTIRAMGSLLSTYQYIDALPPGPESQAAKLGIEEAVIGGKDLREYKGRLLDLALDLGKRLLPAFQTPTGLPYARVNLRFGVEKGESVETCTAGAGSLILEFAVLSRLTGDVRFEALAKRAYLELWNRRSTHDLLGNTIAVTHGQWLAPGMTSVGAGMDSYFEYGIKAAILLGEDTFLDIFQDSYAAVQTHVRTPDGFVYRPVQFRTLLPSSPSTIDSLAAFLPGMQVLAGDLESAIKTHLIYWNIWRKHSAIPESWDWRERKVEWAGWPGRPEFIESTYYLYRATKDPFYLRVGERVLSDLKRRTMTECGVATMKNVDTGELDDRMESFVLSETLKYLYLLFDYTPTPMSNRVFTTEGHALSLPANLLRPSSSIRRQMRRGENLFCPAYLPPTLGGLVVGIERRADYEYARSLVFGPGVEGRVEEDKERVKWWEGGYCEIPESPKFSFSMILAPLNASADDPLPPEDPAPTADKVHQDVDTGNFWIHDIEGLRLGVRWRYDNKGYDVSNIGPHRVRPGQTVIVTDPKMEGFLPVPTKPPVTTHLPAEVLLRFSTINKRSHEPFLHGLAGTATFGKDFGKAAAEQSQTGMGIGSPPVQLIRPKSNTEGCDAFPSSDIVSSDADPRPTFIVDRGGCTFFRKAYNAYNAGAGGIIILGFPPANHSPTDTTTQDQRIFKADFVPISIDGEGLIRPSAEEEPQRMVDQLGEDFGVLYLEYIVGGPVLDLMAEGTKVGVEMFDLDMGDNTREEGTRGLEGSKGTKKGDKAEKGAAREGRVMVAGWDIWNLRIIERPP